MSFKAVELEEHWLDGNRFHLKYHRLSTKLEIRVDDELVHSCHLYFRPLYKACFKVEDIEYQLSITWFLIWRSKLKKNDKVEIGELFPRRRRKSVVMLGYLTTVACLKVLLL
ncbi:hypothetical protein JQC92_15825 [Shewanella sp. 202IG2-18]|uniref:hypothetical protein n=1 Tax=Parashewanella hymeniacidonis TaxID=2807618 RepID=UPI001960752B|nr:hypothetical protein [Parashewanella hymeniacidonis]MBM7073483.1 hypothetical protein [Parashewanella hymeniacidonis]